MAIVACLLLVVYGCTPDAGASTSSSTTVSDAKNALVLVAMADGSLAAVDVAGKNSSHARVLLSHVAPAAGAHVLARAGKTVFALAARQVVAVSLADGPERVIWRTELPSESGRVGAIAVGPVSGRIYVVGVQGGSLALTTIESTGSDVGVRELRPADGHDWWPYEAVASPDERSVFVSYHGKDTTGVDQYPLMANGAGCETRQRPASLTCLPGHGHIQWFGRDLFVATGMSAIERIAPSQGESRRYETTLANNHLMEFAIDRGQARVFAAGSCGYSGGLVAIDIRTGRVDRLGSAGIGAGAICGERIAITADLIILTRTAKPVPQEDRPGALLVLDRIGRVVAHVALPSEATDLLVVPR